MKPQDFNGKYGDCSVEVLPQEPEDLYELMRLQGQTTVAMIPHHGVVPTREEELAILAKLDVETASGMFQRNRAKVAHTLGSLASYVFEKHKMVPSGGVDFGSGVTGAMVHDLLAKSIYPSGWAEVDIHPEAVRGNKKLHPGAVVFQGSYHDVESLGLQNSLHSATGLSSLDATFFIDHAVQQIGSALVEGGKFFHLQDVRPGGNTGFQVLERSGVRAPYVGEVSTSRTNNAIITFLTPTGRVSVGELFRRNIGHAIANEDTLELEMNDWVIAKRPVKDDQPGKLYQMNICLELPSRNDLSTLPPEFKDLLGRYIGFEQSLAVATVARKK